MRSDFGQKFEGWSVFGESERKRVVVRKGERVESGSKEV